MVKQKIAMVTSEFAPFAKTGGLADMVAALSGHLHGRGHDVRTFLPLYGRILESGIELEPMATAQDVPVQLGPWRFRFSLFAGRLPGSGQTVFFIDCPQLYHRPGIYTSDPDEHLRFILLSRAVLESAQRLQWAPDILHCHDWQAAWVPLFLKTIYSWDALFHRTRTLFTIHNIGYQGSFSSEGAADLSLGDGFHMLHQDDYHAGLVNPMKHALLHADAISTVSPTYAQEIQTDEFGMRMQDVLRDRDADLFGILNGVDYAEWSPESDPHIPHRFSLDSLEEKEKNKKSLIESMGIDYQPGVPAVGVVSRLTYQKGFDLLFDALPRTLRRRDLRVVALGSGEPKYEGFFMELQRAFPGRAIFYNGYNNQLAHWIEAGCDLFLMPSRYEPCGLNQMYSLRYGTLPVVRRTGGLADTVQLVDPSDGSGNGLVFDHFTGKAFEWALNLGLDVYDQPKLWRRFQKNAMKADFSWDRQGRYYEDLYRSLIGL